MSRWRIGLVAALLIVPFVILAGIGSYYLWSKGWGFIAWWPMAASLTLGYCLAWYWQRKRELLRPPDFAPPMHWTDRDRAAWKLVEARARDGAQLDPVKFSDVPHYLATAQEMAVELATFYHPRSTDPIGKLTVPEILAVVELASHDLAEMVDRYLPGGHLLTVNDWRTAKKATDWYQSGSKLYWAISALFAPYNTALRYVASQAGMAQPLKMLQQNLLLWFYTAFIHRVGTYLIDLNSGRLRVGATRYRELLQASRASGVEPPADAAAPSASVEAVRKVTITLMGQVKAGKSSLINALLGEQKARTDVLPATNLVERYELPSPGIPTRLVLLDTVGYAHTGPKADLLAATHKAAQESDLLFLVLHARNPARQADLAQLEDLRHWYGSHPELKRPPLVAVVTHIDLLSPAMEWSPPYNWKAPTRPKEVNIHQALEVVREQMGPDVVAVVPVCAAAGKVYGIDEWLLPAMAELLDEARGVALLRCLKAEADAGKMTRVFHQLLAAGLVLFRIGLHLLAQPAGEKPQV